MFALKVSGKVTFKLNSLSTDLGMDLGLTDLTVADGGQSPSSACQPPACQPCHPLYLSSVQTSCLWTSARTIPPPQTSLHNHSDCLLADPLWCRFRDVQLDYSTTRGRHEGLVRRRWHNLRRRQSKLSRPKLADWRGQNYLYRWTGRRSSENNTCRQTDRQRVQSE